MNPFECGQSNPHDKGLLEDTLKEHNLFDSLEQIYNMDESGMPLDPRPPNVIPKRGQKKVRYRVSEKKKQITILGCANALGQAIPPTVIFEGEYLNLQWTEGEVKGMYCIVDCRFSVLTCQKCIACKCDAVLQSKVDSITRRYILRHKWQRLDGPGVV